MAKLGVPGVLGIVLMMVVGGFGGLLLYMNAQQPDTTGVAYEYKGILGGSNANGAKDLLDSTAYVTSWTGDKSEKIVIQGMFKNTGSQLLGSDVASFRYVVYLALATGSYSNVKINGQPGGAYDTGWVPKGTISIGGGWVSMQNLILIINGPCTGTIRAEMYAQYLWLTPLPKTGAALFAADEAALRSGIGSVKVQNSPSVVEEGTNASLFVETGYASPGVPNPGDTDLVTGGWTLNIYNPSGTSVLTKKIPDNFAGTVKYLVPNGSYSPSATNVYKVILRNVLIDQADSWFFVVGPGMLKKIPNLPSFKSTGDGKTLIPGDQISVTVTSIKNPLGYDIKGFWVWVSYETVAGTTTQYVIEKAWYPATNDTTGSFSAVVTFTFPDAGQVRLQASAADSMNLNSGISSMQWTVYPKPPTPPPPGPDGGNQQLVAWIVGAAIMGLLILFAFVVMFKVPHPLGLIIAIVLMVIAVVVAWAFFIGGLFA